MSKQAPKAISSGAKSNPGQVKTGISRRVLLQLRRDEGFTIGEILKSLGPRRAGVTHGTIWTTLERARLLGLVRSETETDRKRPRWYFLTEGGQRRVDWIQRRKSEVPRTRVVANPGREEE